jgi:hypothetical protein
MLEKQGYAKDTIVSFKLVNGDEIVAKIIAEDAGSFTVSKPCTVVPSAKGLGLIQSLFTSDLNKSISIDKGHVMLHATTVKDVEDYYIETTTGITPATAGGIIT